MGSDDTLVTNSVFAVQEPESASAAKTTPSDGSGGADESGPSTPSSRRDQEQVQNLNDKCEVMDVPMGPVNNLIDETVAPVKESEITSVASMRSGRADPTPSDSSGGGDGSGKPCPWSLTQEEHERNLKNNCSRAFMRQAWLYMEDDSWFASFVAEVRNSFLQSSGLQMVDRREGPYSLERLSPLHLAILMGDLKLVLYTLETSFGPYKVDIDSIFTNVMKYSALDLAIVGGEREIVDVLLEKNAKVNKVYTSSSPGALQLAVLFARAEQTENTSKIIQSLVRNGFDIKVVDGCGYSAFYLAVANGKTDIVKELLKWKEKIQLNETYRGGRPPIQIAHEEGFKDIESALMQCDDVKSYIDSAFRDRQVYVDAANAILVGAALIASVTFASWLQPPLGYTTSYHAGSVEYVDVEHTLALGSFWVFNTLSFYFAIGTVVFGAHSVLPRRDLFITETVKKLSQNLLLTSILLAFSVLFVIIAFGIAGLIVLIPILRYRWFMIVPMILGGIVCVGSIGYLFKSIWANTPSNIGKSKSNSSEVELMDENYRKHLEPSVMIYRTYE